MAKKEADRISYGWDSIIDRAHDATSARYELVARELTRPDRFQRRILSKSFFDAYCEFRESRYLIMRRLTTLAGTTYCFLFMEDGKEPRETEGDAISDVFCGTWAASRKQERDRGRDGGGKPLLRFLRACATRLDCEGQTNHGQDSEANWYLCQSEEDYGR